jgi:hypothetical protein
MVYFPGDDGVMGFRNGILAGRERLAQSTIRLRVFACLTVARVVVRRVYPRGGQGVGFAKEHSTNQAGRVPKQVFQQGHVG